METNKTDETAATEDTNSSDAPMQFTLPPGVKNVVIHTPQGSLALELTYSSMALRVVGDLTLSATGAVNIEGTTIALRAANQLDMRSDGVANLEGMATTEIKGSVVRIN